MAKTQTEKEPVVETPEVKKEFTVTILVSEKNLSYKSDFNEAETIFWLEAVKNLVIKKTFEVMDAPAV
jgi:hypothetical protein